MDENGLKELRDLVEFLKANGIAEFEMERSDLKVGLKFVGAPATGGVDAATLATLMAASKGGAGGGASVPLPATVTAAPAAPAADPYDGAHIVKSPIVGTFYAAPSPDAEPFVQVGDTVKSGQTVCIVEAMKLMNEIESDAPGKIVHIFVTPGQPVEYGQALFAVK